MSTYRAHITPDEHVDARTFLDAVLALHARDVAETCHGALNGRPALVDGGAR